MKLKGGLTWIIVPAPELPRIDARVSVTMGATRISDGIISIAELN